MGNSKTITVKTEHGNVVVHKMPLADYAELLKALDNVPKQLGAIFGGMDDELLAKMSNVDYLALLPQILAGSWGDLIKVVSIPTDKDAEFMAKLDLPDAVDVVAAILELNDIHRIIAAVKKILALGQKISPAPPKQT